MAGVYGEIGSRADFFRVLGEALGISIKLSGSGGAKSPFGPIEQQLLAIDRWTANGRTPTRAERESLDMGLRAVRELSDTGDPGIDAFAGKIQALHNYVEDWPSDEKAAAATDDDFFDDDDDDHK